MMVHKYLVAPFVVALSLGGTALASSATASPKAEHDAVAVVGAGTSVVETLDEQGNANQETVQEGDSQTAENDSHAQENDADVQEGDSGTNEDGTANDSDVQSADAQDQAGDAGTHETGSANDAGTHETGSANESHGNHQDGPTSSGATGQSNG
jgi:hypothetical protein